MRLDEARAAKQLLRAEAAATLSSQEAPGTGALVALGLSPDGSGGYAIAVRHAGTQVLAQRIAARAMQLTGTRCDLRDVGQVTAQQWSPGELQRRVRPLRPGVSIGHVDITAGTLGALVRPRDGAGPPTLALSNNHVLADSDRGSIGDVVVQPGPVDGGSAGADRIGVLDRFVPLRSGEANAVDAAAAVLDPGVGVEPAHPAGLLAGWAEPDIDVDVEKAGRTTGLTRGRVTAIEIDGLAVSFPGRLLTFDGQIEVSGDGSGPFSAGGDSGSLVYDPVARVALGLLFAGSERGGADGFGLTYCNPIDRVFDELAVDLVAADDVSQPPGAADVSRDEVRAAKDELADRLRADPRVAGVGITRSYGRYAVRVAVVDPDDLPAIPAQVHGIEVRVTVVGRIVPRP